MNNTTFPHNWKELVRAGPPIFQLYLQYLYDGQVRYGPNTIVFMQVGMFHEMYGVENELMHVGLVSQLSHSLNIQMTRRKKKIKENSPRNYLMAGFPSVHLDRYINTMVSDNWTVIVVDQIETLKELEKKTISLQQNPGFMGLTDLFKTASTIEEEDDEDEDDDEDENAEEQTDRDNDKDKDKNTAAKKGKKNVKNVTNVTKNKNKNKKTVSRYIAQVCSPSTFVDKTMKDENNFLVSVFLQEDKLSKSSANRKLSVTTLNEMTLLSAGCSAIDLTTGENFSYEIYSNIEDEGLAIDEVYRFLCTFQPREIIINSENLKKYNEEMLTSKLDLHNIPHHIKLNQVRNDFKKISYQNSVLQKCFPDHGSLTPLEFLDMEVKGLAALSYVLMLQYAYEHNERLINNLPRPKILDTYALNKRPKNLILSNNTINQLNLIPEMGSTNNNNSITKVFRSVFTIINKTSTAMGSRLLRHRFLTPITDPDALEEHYSRIEALRQTIHLSTDSSKNSTSVIWKELEKHLKIKDVERINRKISLKTIQPLEWIELDQDLIKVNQLLNVIKVAAKEAVVLDKFMKEKEDVIKNLVEMQDYYKNVLDLDQAAKYTLSDVEDNFFKTNFDSELDSISFKIKHYEQFFKTLTRSLSNIITPGSDYITLKRGDGGFYLMVTKTRFAVLKTKFQDPINFSIDTTNYTIDPKELVETPVSKKSSNLNVQNETLTKMSLELAVLHEELRARVIEKYYSFLEDFSKKFGKVLTHISLIIARIDVLKSIAKVADEYNYCKPEIIKSETDDSFIVARSMRHPIIERINQTVKYVPHSICLGKVPKAILSHDSKDLPKAILSHDSKDLPKAILSHDSKENREELNVQDGMLIFGLNCSGKSSLMKSVGINLILAQAGFYVAATSFKFYPYSQILTRIISEDNLFKGQSTFEVEMTELRGILSRAKNSQCLVLGDELTHGSETTSGLAIVAAATITLARSGVSFIFTSHLHALSSMPRIKELPNVRSYHLRVIYDEAKDILIYDRTLNEGSGQAIYGLEVLRSLHINQEFLGLAHEIRREIMEVPSNIIAIRQSKYNSDLYMNECQICKGLAEDTHHISEQCKANEKGFIDHYHKNVLSNLVVLCKKCHLAAHGKSADNKNLKINGWLETSNGIKLDYTWL